MTDAARHAADLRNYVVVTGAYWADTIADGAIRLLVLFFFYERGYSPLEVASLFLFYELFGIATNLVGGWLAARLGLRFTLLAGLGTQLVALGMLAAAPGSLLVVAYVMVAQALSGIAKDLTKMSSKSAIKLIVPADASGQLYRWVALLTGSKNALKGVGFFVGGLLLTTTSFRTALLVLMALVLTALLVVLAMMRGTLGEPDRTARFRGMFSTNRAVNVLAGARIFLFAARDVWFVVALPVYLRSELGWSFWQVGSFLAIWVIGYGAVQASAPRHVRDPDGAHRRLAGVHAGAAAGGPRRGAHDRRRRRRRARGGPDRLRRGVRPELRGPQLPHPRLRRGRQGRDERRLLLHGQRVGPPRRHDPLGRAVPVEGPRSLPARFGRVRAHRGAPVTLAAGRSGGGGREGARRVLDAASRARRPHRV